MNILHIGKYYPPCHGGIENFVKDLSEAQVELGHSITVLCHQHSFSLRPTRELHNSIQVIRAPILGRLAFAPLSPSFVGLLYAVQKNNSPDVIHVHLPNLSALVIAFLPGLSQIVVHWHSDVVSAPGISLLRLLYPVYQIFEQRLLQRARRIIVTSRAYLETSRPLAPYSDKCAVIPLGLQLQRMTKPSALPSVREPDRARAINHDQHLHNAGTGSRHVDDGHSIHHDAFWLRIAESRWLVVAVGRFTIYKGFDVLIRAAKLLPHVTFVIVGDGPLWKNMNALARTLGVEQNVLLPGSLANSDLHRLLAECDVFALSSVERTEAFGLVLLEAMHYGKSLITTSVVGSGMSEVNIHGQTGLVVPVGDAQAMAQAIDTLCTNSSLRNTLGSNAHQRLRERFTIGAVAQQVDRLYGSIHSR
ncbi:MAG TPA: glycosyltransferase [Thermodesulfobacteriota bacterium]|nr:glycosyltransferase [Thermodesulfobacteriota bacterium]HNU72254.1 glycosyltransferase [Thermodesulfobacteriota bacterium]